MTPTRRLQPVWVFAALAITTSFVYALFAYRDVGRLWSPLDDAFIYAQYAREMARGNFYEYHPGEGVTTGVTSPLYPWCLVPAFWVGMGGERIATWWLVLGIVWRFGTALLIFALVTKWVRDRRPAWAAAGLVLMSGAYNWGVSSGMEVGMVGIIVAGSLWAGHRWATALRRAGSPEERKRRWIFGVMLALLLLSRPEGTLTAIVAMVWIGWWLRRDRHARKAWGWLGIAFIPWLAWTLWMWIATGLVSMTGKVKTVVDLPGFDTSAKLVAWFDGIRQTLGTEFLGVAGLPVWSWIVVAVGAVWLWGRRCRGSSRIAGRLPGLWLAGFLVPALSLVPFVQNARYQAAHVPVLVALGVVGVWRIGIELPGMRRLVWGGLALLAAVTFISGFFVMGRMYAMQTEDMANIHIRVARWIDENAEKDDRIAVTDAGIIPYLSNRRSIDFVGLTNLAMVGSLIEGSGGCWHTLERLPPEQRPDWLVMFPPWFDATVIGIKEARFVVDRTTVAVGPEMIVARWAPPLPWLEKRVPPEARAKVANANLKTSAEGESWLAAASGSEMATAGRVDPRDGLTTPSDSRDGEPRREDRPSTSALTWRELGTLTTHALEPPTTFTWQLRDWIDMADLQSQREHAYQSSDEARWGTLQRGPLITARAGPSSLWKATDGGRSWTEREQYTLHNLDPEKPVRFALRTYADFAHRLRVWIGDGDAGILSVPVNNRSPRFDILVFDLEKEFLGGHSDPHVRLEMIRDGGVDEYPFHTSFFLWALQPEGKAGAAPNAIEAAIEEAIGREAALWADTWREKRGDAIPIDSQDPVVFASGWGEPEKGSNGSVWRWGLGPRSALVIPAPDPFGECMLEFTLEPYVPPNNRGRFWNWVAVEVNGTELGRWNLAPRKETYCCVVPEACLYPSINDVRFVYGRTYVPAQFEPGNPAVEARGAKFFDIALRSAADSTE